MKQNTEDGPGNFAALISSLTLMKKTPAKEIIIKIIIIHSLELFTSALADGFSLESEWQQVSSSFQNSPQYSGWS